jgi:hypothetical protein
MEAVRSSETLVNFYQTHHVMSQNLALLRTKGARGRLVVDAPYHKTEGRGFETDEIIEFF